MAARPNALRTLAYGRRLAENHLIRLREMIAMTENALQLNKTLTADDVAGYRACIIMGKNQIKKFEDIAGGQLPAVDLTTKRGRGRPSDQEYEQLAVSRQVPNVQVQAAPRRGRPPKNEAPPIQAIAPAISTPEAQPKRRGRPPKNPQPVAQVQQPVPVATPKRRGRPPKNPQVVELQAPEVQQVAQPKRRGRPPKNAQQVIPQVIQEAAPKRRGRPPKNPQPVVEQTPAPVARKKRVAKAPAEPASVAVQQPAAPKRRGRPPKVNTAPISDAVPVKRGPGRPPGSKNKPKVINGQNTALQQTG